MEFKTSQAIYLQIGDYVCEQILLGRWPEGDRILSVRELGVALEVNPNTVMRTYDFLQGLEIIFNKRGVGYFVTEGAKQKIKEYRKEKFLQEDLPVVFKNMELLEMTIEEIEYRYSNYLKAKQNENQY
jgi:DNA-binding transcriptional regulator YhcF (GntR family)